VTLELAVIGVGMVAEIVAWRLVVAGRASVWRAMTPTFVLMGAAAALVRRPVIASDMSTGAALALGVLAGVLLYVATVIFVAVVSGWRAFQRQTTETYALAEDVPIATVALLAGVMVVGEELFWRALVQPRFAEAGRGAGAALTWLAFVLVNSASSRLPIIAAAAVGGAVWALLAWWTGGMLASLLCHLIWTTLMIVRPPRRRAKAAA
jgi:membrane protease YdiL (CAAX protease family)